MGGGKKNSNGSLLAICDGRHEVTVLNGVGGVQYSVDCRTSPVTSHSLQRNFEE